MSRGSNGGYSWNLGGRVSSSPSMYSRVQETRIDPVPQDGQSNSESDTAGAATTFTSTTSSNSSYGYDTAIMDSVINSIVQESATDSSGYDSNSFDAEFYKTATMMAGTRSTKSKSIRWGTTEPERVIDLFKGELSILNVNNIKNRSTLPTLYVNRWNTIQDDVRYMYMNRVTTMLSTDAIIAAARIRLQALNAKTNITKVMSIFDN